MAQTNLPCSIFSISDAFLPKGSDLNTAFGKGGPKNVAYGITATPSGTQVTSLILQYGFNQVSTVTTSGDGVKLPPTLPGVDTLVYNSGSNSMNVYPYETSTQINGGTAGTAIAQAAGTVALYRSFQPGQIVRQSPAAPA